MRPVRLDMWVDFARVYHGVTFGDLEDAVGGTVVKPGRYIVVGNDDADPAVAEVVQVNDDGTVLLRVLLGHVDSPLNLIGPRPA